jgi:poly(3-hydroxybutyrate) depolymerase
MTTPLRTLALALAFAGAAALAPEADAADALPRLHADPARTSVSGLSSGGFMAVQYGVAFSASVQGIGVVAGGPYGCASVNVGGILTCLSGQPSGEASWASVQALALAGEVDPAAGLARQKAYVFSGSKDQVVARAVVAATRDFFKAAGMPAKNLAYVDTVAAGHAFVVLGFGNSCGSNAAPYIVHCSVKSQPYDQAGAILRQVYGVLKPPAVTLSSTVRPFDQRDFANAASSLDSVGFVYVPTACASGSGCAVHVVFHGCLQGAQSVGSDVYASVGYNRWADTNRLIVLYPQVVKSEPAPYNPQGCWDWWGTGYTGPAFALKSGVQMAAVKAMVDRLTGQ